MPTLRARVWKKIGHAALALGLAAAWALSAPAARAADVEPWSPEDCWPFIPPADAYSGQEMFTLRTLLDDTAGERGWIRLDGEGGFCREDDGSPIRFWATGSSVFEDNDLTMAKMEAHAKHLAKRGINLVRLFRSNLGNGPQPNPKFIEQYQMAISAFKKQGIYSLITIYWNTGGPLFWDEALQANYKNWWRELLTRPNPYDPGRLPLKDDPAVAILQIQNEAGMFWWNMQEYTHQTPADKRALADQFNRNFKAWLAENGLPPCEFNTRFWDINRADPTHSAVASQDLQLSMRYLAEWARGFNAHIESFLKDEIGCPALVNAGNWYTADAVRLNDHERWTYDANDVIAVNRYVDFSRHQGPDAGWLVEPGDLFQNGSCMQGDNWRGIPTGIKQIKGKPMLVTETGWVAPNLYQAEAPFLVSAYMSLTGVDACFWLGIGKEGFDPYSWPYRTGVYKWGNHASPQNMGGWPAAAWMFHQGYLRKGDLVVDEKRGLEGDMWDLRVPVIAEDATFDPNQPGTARAQSNVTGGAPYGAFLMGPVEVEYGANPADTVIDLHGANPAELARGRIESTTGEVLMDAPRGICVVDAACAQGVVGFLSQAGPVKTGALEIDLQNEYAAVLAVSLDGEPLAESAKVLLQTTTMSRPNGWVDEPATREDGSPALRIVNTGGGGHNAGQGHWMVKNTHGTVSVRNLGLSRATLTDINHYAVREIPVRRADEWLVIDLPEEALYIVLE